MRGQVLDSSSGVEVGANINLATNIRCSMKTNNEGMYLLADMRPGNYQIQISHAGFKTIVKPDVLLNFRDAVVINFTLPLVPSLRGSLSKPHHLSIQNPPK